MRNMLLFTALLIAGIGGYMNNGYKSFFPALHSENNSSPSKPEPAIDWPPTKQKPFPDLELTNQDGKTMNLRDFQGKVILLEVIGMSCPACNAWSGAQEHGRYNNIDPQDRLPSIKQSFTQYTGLEWNDPRVVFVQILLFNLSMQTPTAENAHNWAEHFDFQTAQNEYVFAGQDILLDPAHYDASYTMIPGFYLIDKNFIVQADATGHQPKDNLYTFLLPMISKLL
jgi:hypothetical protein